VPSPVSPEPPEPAAQPLAAPVEARDDESSERTGELRIVVIPFGDVWVDDKARGPAPVTAKLSPGSHDVAWGDGRPEERRSVHVEPGAHDNLVFRRRIQAGERSD
jgi:hypothetical protein